MNIDNVSIASPSSFNTALSELSGRLDANPHIPPDISVFVDAFDDDEMNDLMELTEDLEEVAELNELTEIGGTDFLEICNAFAPDKPEEDNKHPDLKEIKSIAHTDIPSGSIEPRTLITHEQVEGPYSLFTEKNSTHVFLVGTQESKRVGVSSIGVEFDIDIKTLDYYKCANMYSEEVGGKGVNLGFSSFYHSTAIMIIAKNTDGVIEPHDGHDYAWNNYTFEITGQNYLERKTNADVIINKYLLNSCMLSVYSYHYSYQTWSWNEDSGVITSFYDTGFDYNTTTRSRIMRKLATLLPKITNAQRDSLGQNYLAYCHNQGMPEDDTHAPNRDYTLTCQRVRDCITEGAKLVDGKYYVPAPFRLLYPQDEPEILLTKEVEERQSLQVFTTDYGESTYHTWNIDNDPREILRSKCDKYPEKNTYQYKSLHDALYEKLKEYKSFCYASMQAALLPKINGKGGCFYDRYNRAGIAWYRQNSSALTWVCVFYTFSNPGAVEEVGKWSYNEMKQIFVSPSFKVSRQDIHYASVLPAKIAAALSGIRPLMDPSQYASTEPKIIMAMGLQSNSTWATSHRTGANRFLTCCHVSSSGDLPALIEGQLKSMNKHRFCDYFQLSLFLSFINEQPSTNVTPLLRLPFAAMAYEKDFSQTLQWHMRNTDHATQCMVKVTDAAKRHRGTDEAIEEWFNIQYNFIEQMLNNGITILEYKDFMSKTPAFPALNLVAFIGMCNITKNDIKEIGSVQHAMGFSVWSMITDRHCTEYKGFRGGMHHIKCSRVAEAMSRYLHSISGVTGGYELIAKMAAGERLPPNLLLNHHKDAKEADREISQMYPQHRIKQCFPETLVETFTGNNPDDMMSDAEKYNKHVLDTMNPDGKGKAGHVSEDRSRFCQEQDPQSQGLALGCISYEANSTCLRSAAAMTLQNKTRDIVYPVEADRDSLLEGLERKCVMIENAKEKNITECITIERNMTQGLGAVTGGAINTVFVSSHARIVESMIPGLDNISSNTTSDDVKRTCHNNSNYSHNSVARVYKSVPNRNIHMAMMAENKKKFIFSRVLSEFNNVVATCTGMISQSPIFATLTIQPLLSKSLFGDLSTVVNTTRSTLSWGCPPDVMQCGFFAMLRVFRQKWLLSEEEMEIIWLSGLLPRDVSEHLEGFWIRNDNTMKRLYSKLDDDQKKMLIEGRVTIYDSMKRCELDLGRKRKKKKMKIEPIKGLNRANEVLDTVLSQRLVAERLMSRHIQPLHPSKRAAAKAKFFEMLSGEHVDVDIGDVDALRPARVQCHVRAAREVDRIPCSLGTSASLPADSLQRIRARRYLGVNYRDHPNANEERVAQLDDDDFKKEMAVLERSTRHQGFSFKAPCGKPLTRLFDNRIFKRPASFTFSVDMVQPTPKKQPFTHRGRQVYNFKPCLYGSYCMNMLQRKVSRRKYVLAFGVGTIDGVRYAFYKLRERRSEVTSVAIPDRIGALQTITQSNLLILYADRMDASPLLTIDHRSRVVPDLPGVVGDNDAILNYGFYCRSSIPQGFKVYQDLFTQHNSVIPSFVMNHMPSYPFFPLPTTDIGRGNITSLHNYSCINKLKLVSINDPPPHTQIDLGGVIPQRITLNLNEEFIDW